MLIAHNAQSMCRKDSSLRLKEWFRSSGVIYKGSNCGKWSNLNLERKVENNDVAEPCIHLANNAKEIYNCINGDDMCNALSLCVEAESNLKQIKAWIIEKSESRGIA